MNARMVLSGLLALLCWAMPTLAEPGPGVTRYRVHLVLYPGDDGAAVAKRLAAIYRGTLETPVDSEGGFVIALSPAGADLMERDPAVGRLVAAEASAATALVPETTGVATPWKLGNYEYDGSGNIRRIGSEFFVYDTRNRLVVSADASALPVAHKQTYTYDNFANLTAITTAGAGQTTLAVDTSSNQVTTVSGGLAPASLVYDAVGNLTRYGTATYTYDALNMLTRSSIDGVTRHYVYSANDERIGTVEVSGAGTRSEWTLRDPGGQVLRRVSRESDGSWKWQEDYIYRGTQMLAAEVPDASKTRHFHLDHLGTPRLITGNGGAELSRHNYHPFGVEIEPTSTSATTITREKKQFTGHERDAESLDYMHARFYAPYMGRFLSVDPANSASPHSPQSWNRYTYAANNPAGNLDPDGRATKPAEAVASTLESAGSYLRTIGASLNGGGAIGVAADTTFATLGDVISGTGDMFRVGDAVGAAIGSGATGDNLAVAVAQDVGRASSLVLTMAAPAAAVNTRLTTTTVVHFTDDAGRTAIGNSGHLRAGTYVTKPSEVSGLTPAQVESKLQISPGKGAHSFTLRVPNNMLGTPPNGLTEPVTGAWQRVLNRQCSISDALISP